MRVPLSGADLTGQEIEAVVSVLRSGVLSIGPKVEEFEGAITARVGTRHAVAVNSGTSALHLLVRAHGIGDGDEVITSPFSFVASANCALFERASPVFVDIDPGTYNLDVDRIERAVTLRTRAIIPVSVFGQPVNMKAIGEIARRHDLVVIEDACEALGSEYDGIPAGSLGNGAAFAFYPNKQITTAEGGVVVTNDGLVAAYCRSVRNQGRSGRDGDMTRVVSPLRRRTDLQSPWLHHERLGYNYRLSELHAALGVVQMKRLDQIIERRQRIADAYAERLRDSPDLILPQSGPGVTKMSWQAYVVQVRDGVDRDGVMDYLLGHGISCRPYFTPIHLQPFYVQQFGYEKGDFPLAEHAGDHTIALPFFNRQTDRQIDYVAANLKLGCTRCRQRRHLRTGT
jgi:perosamine synthetase